MKGLENFEITIENEAIICEISLVADIRKSIDKEIRRKCIDTGREYAEKSPPIGRNSMGIIAESLLRSNNAAALMSRSAIITNFCSVFNFNHQFRHRVCRNFYW